MHFWQSLEKFSTVAPKKSILLTVRKRVLSKFSILRVNQYKILRKRGRKEGETRCMDIIS